MGNRSKKLREWCRYEFGTALEGISGNCRECVKYFKKQSSVYTKSLEAGLPWLQPTIPHRVPTCEQCPKFKLYPGETFGLHPNNLAAVEWYYQATRDQRVGFGAELIGTLCATDAEAVLRIHEAELPTDLSRVNAFEKLVIINEVATDVRRKAEQRKRDAQAKK